MIAPETDSGRAPGALRCDIAIVGGGLAGGLAVLALRQARPDWDVRLVEPGPIGGNHIWSFFDGDISEAGRALLEPLIAQRWNSYDVRFPAYQRHIDMAYNSITGERLAAAVEGALRDDNRDENKDADGAWLRQAARLVTPISIELDDGRTMDARHVLDARGFDNLSGLHCGWQKFVGQALKIAGGHGLTAAIVMDASVAQIDGYRFVYCLPLDDETLFVEDTYYSDDAALDRVAVAGRIATYAEARGWQVSEISREEAGVLPVVMAGDFDRLWPAGDALGRIGVRAGSFHATTGYSLPFAVETALALPDLLDGDDVGAALRARAAAHWRRQRFYRLLSTMLFRAAEPAKRYAIFQRFYRLSPQLVGRFYAGRSHLVDKMRILAGKPPVRVGRAIAAIKDLNWV